jgi:CRISP-associated protein Cas1
MGLPVGEASGLSEPLVPARVINEHVYCPRLAWLEWEARAFTDNVDTAEGSDAHRRTDQVRGDDDASVLTSVVLSSERLGVTAKVDRVELRDGRAVPVGTKHGEPPSGRPALWPPELAQLSAQALLLREAGYEVDHGEVFFVDSRRRQHVDLPDDAEQWIRILVAEVRANAAVPVPPPPLRDSPKCPRCSLVGICLPDETAILQGDVPAVARRLVARDDPRRPLYVTGPSAIVRKRRGRLVLEVNGTEEASRRMLDVAHVAVFGNVVLTAGAIRGCLEQDTPVLWFTSGGWFTGYTIAHGGSWVARRIAQVNAAQDPARHLPLARAFIEGKLRNQRTLLRRLAGVDAHDTVYALARLVERVASADSLESLLGIEGTGARLYFSSFPRMLKAAVGNAFDMSGRNRRPPTDPINAAPSFVYALLTKDTTVAALAAGLDPQIGLMHQPRFGRPSLALDLAEEMRPLVAESTVVTLPNNGGLRDDHFVRRIGAVALTAGGRKQVITGFERRMAVRLRHPVFGYQVTYRRALELQARQLAAVLDGQLASYRPLITR